MNEREKIIRLWFDMWIKKADLGIDNIFTDDVVYSIKLQAAEGSFVAQAAVWNNRLRSR